MMIRPSWNPDLRVYELDADGGALVQAIRKMRAQQPARTGLHLSTITQDMARTLDPKTYAREMDEATSYAYQETGNIIEDVIADGLHQRGGWTKPAPKRVDGVWMSPDGWSGRERCIDEIKVTWKSMREFFETLKFQMYCWQALSYAYGWDAERVRFHMLFINGDYPRGAPIPAPRTFTVRWTDGVPKQQFNIVRQHAVDRGWL